MWSKEETKNEQKFKLEALADKAAELPDVVDKHYWSRSKSRTLSFRQREEGNKSYWAVISVKWQE